MSPTFGLLLVGSLVILVSSVRSASPPRIEWQYSYGGGDEDAFRSMQQTADGGYILCGFSDSQPEPLAFLGNKTSPFRGGGDLWVVRLDSNGHILWNQSFGGDSIDGRECSIRQTRDGGFILTGETASGISGNKTTPAIGFRDIWVVRLDASGAKLWEVTLGGENSEFYPTIEETADGGFILGASSGSGISGNKSSPNQSHPNRTSPGNLDYWLVRLDANGIKLWDRSFGGISDDKLHAVQQTSDGGFILGGESQSPASGNKTSPGFAAPLWSPDDFWVVRVDQNGDKLWEKSYGGTSLDAMFGLVQTADGGFLFGGLSYSETDGNKRSPRLGTIDYWIVRTDAVGEILWDKTFGGGGVNVLRAVRPVFDGGFVLGGYSDDRYAEGRVGNKTSPGFGSDDYWVVRLDGEGRKLWETSLGGSGGDLCYDLQPAADGGFLIGGTSDSVANGNKTSPRFAQSSDFWVVKLAPEDSDSDGVPDLHDACPDTSAGSVVNSSGCSIEQLCPCDGPWKNHGQYVLCVLRTSAQFFKAGLITRAERRQIVKEAFHSDCGKQHPVKRLPHPMHHRRTD